MARRLKVFRYSDGFHAWTVAAPSRAKALAAWGVRRDLFKDGSAQEIDDGPDADAARERPGELIERGLAVDVGQAKTRKTSAKAKAATERARAKVEALEKEIADLDDAQAGRIKEFERKEAELAREREEAEAAHAKVRAALARKLKTARGRT